MERKIHVEIDENQVKNEICYMCSSPAVIAIRGDKNEPGTGFCLCQKCFDYTLGNLLDKALLLKDPTLRQDSSSKQYKSVPRPDSSYSGFGQTYYGTDYGTDTSSDMSAGVYESKKDKMLTADPDFDSDFLDELLKDIDI